MSTPHCGTCRFFHETGPRRMAATEDPVTIGLCRRKAPVFHGQSPYARWPEVRDTDWCGEFQERVTVIDDPARVKDAGPR